MIEKSDDSVYGNGGNVAVRLRRSRSVAVVGSIAFAATFVDLGDARWGTGILPRVVARADYGIATGDPSRFEVHFWMPGQRGIRAQAGKVAASRG